MPIYHINKGNLIEISETQFDLEKDIQTHFSHLIKKVIEQIVIISKSCSISKFMPSYSQVFMI